MFNGMRDCTLSSSLWVCQIYLEAPLSQTHPELRLQQKLPSREGQRSPVCPSFSCSRLGYRSCLVLGSWLSCCGGERLGLLPDSRFFSRESCRVCLSSPLHHSHTHTHTLVHTHSHTLLQCCCYCCWCCCCCAPRLPSPLTARSHSHTTRPLCAF